MADGENLTLLDLFDDATIPVDETIDAWVRGLRESRAFFQAMREPVDWTLDWVNWVTAETPWPVVVIVFFLLGWQLATLRTGLLAFAAMMVIGLIGAWSEAMDTLALVITAVLFCCILGIPIGILMARSDTTQTIMRPILDAMQTTPAFVYLVPIVILFGIGNAPGVVVTIIFALPPLIRLTNLGIRQVPGDVIEASHAFGASPFQLLFKVQLPLAMPTIMAGLNQTLMLALSMVVIASMIAVGGLGQMVLRGIGRLDMGLAVVGGIGIVLLAIVLDRLTQALGMSPKERGWVHWYENGPAALVVDFIRKSQQSPDASGGQLIKGES